MLNLGAYRQIASMSAQILYVFRFAIAMELLGTVAQIYVLRMIWTSVYAGQETIDGVPLDQLIAYLTLANLHLWVMFPVLAYYLQDSIREGKIAMEIARPVPFVAQMVSRQIGDTASGLPFIAAALPITYFLGGLLLPASFGSAVLYLFSLLLGYSIVALIGLLLGLACFWTTEVGGLMTIMQFVSRFFGGAFVPIALFPPALQTVAWLLPFHAEAAIPLSIYLGQLQGLALVQAVAVQLFWVVALYLAAMWVWRQALRRVTVQGG